jgi:uroporphyrinogen-III decarboxylase
MDKQSLALRGRDSGAKVCDPLGAIQSCEDAERLIPEPGSWGDQYLGGLRRLTGDLGDRCLVLPHDSPGYIKACYAFGFEAAIMAMMFEPELFLYACDRYAAGDELHMRELAAAGAEAVFLADSWASADIISPPMIERFALPYQASITAAAHRVGLRVIMWNEGDLAPILVQEAALPFDAFAFEQPRKGRGVTVAQVREVFGPGRCLLGNLDSEELLLRGSKAAIEQAVREQITQSGEGNPFIMCFGSPLPSNVDPQVVDLVMALCRDGGGKQHV